MEKQSLKVEDARPHFFKIIYGEDIKHHLQIPSAFMRHLSLEMTNTATLTGPSGSHCHWSVTVSTDANGTYLHKGWKEFMKENNLGDKEFLTFRYDGNMHFYVKIFDKSGVIRQAAPGSLDLHKQELHGLGQSPKIGKKVKPFPFQSPHFTAGMTKANVEKPFLLRIPRSFSAAAHFPPSRKKVILRDSAGKAWDVICINGKGTHYLSGGWRSFARHNNLRPGDVCKFELVSTGEMQVQVL